MQDPDFTFGPRHRIVTRTRGFPWARAALTVAVGIALGIMLLFAAGIAHAETPLQATRPAQQAFEQFNDECRDKGVEASCDRRDQIGARLKAMGVCWNPHSATTAQAWVPCVTPKVQASGSLDSALARCNATATKADQITQLRDRMTPMHYVLEWGFPQQLVELIYSGRASSYNGAAYCYSLDNIERLRAQGLS